jgi:hypothetical protein
MPSEESTPDVSLPGDGTDASDARLKSQIYTHDVISASRVALASADYRRQCAA